MASASATIPAGYRQTEVGVIPEDWRVVRLIELVAKDISTGIFKDKRLYGKGNQIIKLGDVYRHSNFIPELASRVPLSSKELCKYSVNVNDIFMALASVKLEGVGKVMFVSSLTEETSFDHNVAIIRIQSNIDSKYIFHLLQSRHVRNFISSNATQVGTTFLKASSLSQLLLPLPPDYNEQKLVSDTFIEISDYINSIKKLITKKREIKQGIMQELLTGKTRLPRFSGKWETATLGQIGEISGAGVDKKIVEGETPVRLVNYLDVYNRSFIYSDELDHHVTAPPSKAINCSVRKGDVFFTPTSEVRDDIAVSAIAMENILDGTYSYHVVRLRIRDDWDLNYRAYAFQTKAFLDQAAVLSDGSGTRYVISLPNFRKLKVLVPSKREQQAIGQILSDMDAEIVALEQRLEKTKAIKQGMMQQLLTGRIRLVDPSTPVEASA